MIIAPDRFIYVGSVRTGSHFIYSMLERLFPNAIRTPQHHEEIPTVLAAKLKYQVPVYTVVRDPIEQIYSLYLSQKKKYPNFEFKKTFNQFLTDKAPFHGGKAPYVTTENYPPGYTIMYRHVADEFFPFEPNFTTFFEFIGVQNYDEFQKELKQEEVGGDGFQTRLYPANKINATDKKKARKLFDKDYEVFDHKLYQPTKAA